MPATDLCVAPCPYCQLLVCGSFFFITGKITNQPVSYHYLSMIQVAVTEIENSVSNKKLNFSFHFAYLGGSGHQGHVAAWLFCLTCVSPWGGRADVEFGALHTSLAFPAHWPDLSRKVTPNFRGL